MRRRKKKRRSKSPQSVKKSKSSQYLIGFCVDLAWCKKEKWIEFLDVLKSQKWTKLMCFCANEGLFEDQMGEFYAKFENSDGLCLSIVNGCLVRFDENS